MGESLPTAPVTDAVVEVRDQPGTRSRGGSPRILALDGIRALAVILVFLCHTGGTPFRGGWIGVDVFFALSGYLITSLLLNEHEATGRVNYSAFYMRRALRLAPALVAAVVLITPFNLWLQGGRIMDSLSSLLYVSNFWMAVHHRANLLQHTWSLSIEEQFYLVWPVCLMICLRYRRLWAPALLGAALFTAAATKLGFSHVGTNGVYYLPTTSLPVLGLGVVAAIYLHRHPLSTRENAFWGSPAVGLFALAGLVAFTVTTPPSDAWVFMGPLLVVAMCPVALILHAAAAPVGRLARLLSKPSLTWLGKRSYGFYLWSTPISSYLFLHHYNPALAAAITAPVALILTAASWRFVEAPFLRIKDRRYRSVGLGMSPRKSDSLIAPTEGMQAHCRG